MNCIKTIKKTHKGQCINMANATQNQSNQSVNNSSNANQNTQDIYAVPSSTIKILAGVISVVSTLILAVGGWMCITIVNLQTMVAINNTNINDILNDTETSDKLKNINTDIDDIIDNINGTNDNDGILTRLKLLEAKLTTIEASPLPASKDISDSLRCAGISTNEIPNVQSSFSSQTVISTDMDGFNIIAKDYVNETILLTYEEDGKDVYFLGQYNEYYHWSGYCITNTYNSDGSLFAICESNFNNGIRENYTSFYQDTGYWKYSKRNIVYTDNNPINDGVTKNYKYNYNLDKNFTNTNIRVYDILTVKDFFDKIENPILLSYYNGNTSNSEYNDNTGKAYLAKYHEDGTIKTLYVGNFVNGNFNDDTGNAWDIAYSDEYNAYFYNTGIFQDGEAINKSSIPKSIKDIKQITSNYTFECDLKWKK